MRCRKYRLPLPRVGGERLQGGGHEEASTPPVASTHHTLITVEGTGALHTMTDTQAKPGKDNR